MSTHDDHIAFVCATPWLGIRARIDVLVNRGELAALVEAASLVAEAEFRDMIPDGDSRPKAVWTALSNAGHPLRWLQPRRTPAERPVYVWSRTRDGGGTLTNAGKPPTPRPTRPYVPKTIDNGAVPDIGSMQQNPGQSLAAFETIMAKSNGRSASVALTFANETGVHRGLITAVQDCFEPLKGAGSAQRTSADDVIEHVVFLAINGGAYDSGGGSADGRLKAWQTLRWLVTSDERATMKHVLAELERCSWIRFPIDTPWFERVAWDGSFGCLSPDGRRFAAVTWTDTD